MRAKKRALNLGKTRAQCCLHCASIHDSRRLFVAWLVEVSFRLQNGGTSNPVRQMSGNIQRTLGQAKTR